MPLCDFHDIHLPLLASIEKSKVSKFSEGTMDLPLFLFFRGKAKPHPLGSWESKDESRNGREKAASKRDRIFSGLLGNHSVPRSFFRAQAPVRRLLSNPINYAFVISQRVK